MSWLAVMNYFEGIVHLIISAIGLWGCFAVMVFDLRILAPIIENAIFGVFSILTGYLLINKKVNGE